MLSVSSLAIGVASGLPLLLGIGEPAVRRIAESSELLRLGPGEPLFDAGAPLRSVHLVATGHVEIFTGRAGRTIAVDLLGPGSMPGFSAALLGAAPVVGARTATAAHLVVIPAEALRALAAEMPAFAERLLESALRESERGAADLVAQRTLSAVQRLALYLLEQIADPTARPARFVLGIEKQLLAIRIGCSQENLSRAFAALRRLGVHTRGQTVVIEDPEVLRAGIGAPPSHPGPLPPGREGEQARAFRR